MGHLSESHDPRAEERKGIAMAVLPDGGQLPSDLLRMSVEWPSN